MKCLNRVNYYTICMTCILLVLTILWHVPPGYSQPREGGNKGRVLLEVIQNGRGMIMPRHTPRTFLRLYDNGVIEYEARTLRRYFLRRSSISKSELNELVKLAGERDLLSAAPSYPPLENLGDALLTLEVSIYRENAVQRISVKNYMPGHPKADGFYPPSLIQLLRKVEDVRPQTSYERQHQLGQLSLPYED